jgi:hypothetical protein
VARSKWRNVHNGHTLRSGLEKRTATYLDSKNVKYEYETLLVEYVVPESTHKYKPDFILPNGVIVECKGRFTPADRKKMSLAIEQNPDLDIRLLFMLDNPISKGSKTTYTKWCEKRGIKCTVSKDGHVPDTWLKERRRKRK